ncbi:hypothetical protein SDC9_61995 [bioreactor metagenome]|uniref:Uncharacterized protein n=1 Tax=bioreactor metagenome TaxID=1076179 RepID=A0A644XNG9_9ZZZZ
MPTVVQLDLLNRKIGKILSHLLIQIETGLIQADKITARPRFGFAAPNIQMYRTRCNLHLRAQSDVRPGVLIQSRPRVPNSLQNRFAFDRTLPPAILQGPMPCFGWGGCWRSDRRGGCRWYCGFVFTANQGKSKKRGKKAGDSSDSRIIFTHHTQTACLHTIPPALFAVRFCTGSIYSCRYGFVNAQLLPFSSNSFKLPIYLPLVKQSTKRHEPNLTLRSPQ